MKKIIVIGVIALFIVVNITSSAGKISPAKTNLNDGSLLGYVNDTSGNPIEGALVRVYFHETYEEDYSDYTGFYHVTNIPICYCLKNATCSKEGYKTEWILLSIDENTTHDFVLTSENQPPFAPTITGPSDGRVGLPYTYTCNAVDPDGDDLRIIIYWGDGTKFITQYVETGVDISAKHRWEKVGSFIIRVSAQDTFGNIGPFTPKRVTMPKDKVTSNMLLLRILERFPLLQQIWNICRSFII